jgi:hypothetical protein
VKNCLLITLLAPAVLVAQEFRGIRSARQCKPIRRITSRQHTAEWAREREPVARVRLSDLAHYELIDSVWFRFDYRKRDADKVLEVVRFHEDQPEQNMKNGLRQPGDRRIVRYRDAPEQDRLVLVSRRQCTLVEPEAVAALTEP